MLFLTQNNNLYSLQIELYTHPKCKDIERVLLENVNDLLKRQIGLESASAFLELWNVFKQFTS